MEERKPMFNARIASPLADRFVEEIVRSRSAKRCNVAGAETPDGLGDELEFSNRNQIKSAELLFATLRLGVEGADRLQSVAEEIQAYRHVHTGREEIEDASAYRIFRGLADSGSANEPVELKPVYDALHAENVSGRDRQGMG